MINASVVMCTVRGVLMGYREFNGEYQEYRQAPSREHWAVSCTEEGHNGKLVRGNRSTDKG